MFCEMCLLEISIILFSTLMISVDGNRNSQLPDLYREYWGQPELPILLPDLNDILKENKYDKRQRPKPRAMSAKERAAPVVVDIEIFVISIHAISEVTMDYRLEMLYREHWTDLRLVWDIPHFNNHTWLVLHQSYDALLWLPDTFFPNARKSINPENNSITHRSLIRLFRLRKGGGVLFSRKLSIVAECPMDLTMFPFDRQTCKLAIESYGYPSSEITYKWKEEQAIMFGDVQLPDFSFDGHRTTSSFKSYTSTGSYSRLSVCFLLSRSWSFALPQLILPASSAVLVSWVSLWMEEETSFQDLITILLTITLLIFSYNSTMPRVSYIKAMDVFLGVCLLFVVLALFRLVLVKYAKKKLRLRFGDPSNKRQQHRLTAAKMQTQDGDRNTDAVALMDGKQNAVQKSLTPVSTVSTLCVWVQKYDRVCQVGFPCTFMLFCLLYFIRYTQFNERLLDSECV